MEEDTTLLHTHEEHAKGTERLTGKRAQNSVEETKNESLFLKALRLPFWSDPSVIHHAGTFG